MQDGADAPFWASYLVGADGSHVKIGCALYEGLQHALPPLHAIDHHAFAICFVGDQLQGHLSADPEVRLTGNEVARWRELFAARPSAAPPCEPADVLDLQRPHFMCAALAAAIPPPLHHSSAGTDDNSGPIPASPSSPPTSQWTMWHYLVVPPTEVTSIGFSVFRQMFPEDALTSCGEPVGGKYQSSSGTQGSSLTALRQVGEYIADHLQSLSRMMMSGAHYVVAGSSLPNPHPLAALPIGEIFLVGFSKGCVVLNEIIAEIASSSTTARDPDKKVDNAMNIEGTDSTQHNSPPWKLRLHFVDGGLNTTGAYLSDRSTLDAFRTQVVAARNTNLSSAIPVFGDRVPALSFATCAQVDVGLYTTARQRGCVHRPFLDFERRMMGMFLQMPEKGIPLNATNAADARALLPPPAHPSVSQQPFGSTAANGTTTWHIHTNSSHRDQHGDASFPAQITRPAVFRTCILEDCTRPAKPIGAAVTPGLASPVLSSAEGLRLHMLALTLWGLALRSLLS